ncbi:MAG TPA: winged helix-turn-helix transcriptional regulator, partial [Roseiflexaceae bacterium]|nr:winged helix-turn-helix transcriptional regulator [Roseiflexaceae bacterium]
ELIAGPRRFKDLLAGLPEISTNLLADRLRGLEQQGLIRRRTLPPPAGSTVYELTAVGQALEPMLLELGRWGSQFVPPAPEDAAVLHAGSYALTLKTFFRPELAQGLDETYGLYVDDEVLSVRIANAAIDVRQGESRDAVATLHTDIASYLALLGGQLQLDQALAHGLAHVEGNAEALRRFLEICRLPALPA